MARLGFDEAEIPLASSIDGFFSAGTESSQMEKVQQYECDWGIIKSYKTINRNCGSE
jgi:hypothetical protein